MKKEDNQKKRADLVIHPVRLRLISLLNGRHLTARELAAQMPEVPQATLYRHLSRLEKAGLIRVAESRPVRGTLEKIYTLGDAEGARFSEEDIREFTREDHERYFSAFIAGLYSGFTGMMEKAADQPELLGQMGYHTSPIILDPEQLPDLQRDLMEVLDRYTALQEQKPESRRFYLSTVFLPEVNHESEL